MPVSEIKITACVFGVSVKNMVCQPYLVGFHFILVTYHKALQYLIYLKDPTDRLARLNHKTIFKLSIVKDLFMKMPIALVAWSYQQSNTFH